MIDGAAVAVGHVRNSRYRVGESDADLFGDRDLAVEQDAEAVRPIAH